jgi:MFS transporter, SP family, galactose:H+ symporter
VVLVVVLFSGALFGCDQGVISGALHGIKGTFSLSKRWHPTRSSWLRGG